MGNGKIGRARPHLIRFSSIPIALSIRLPGEIAAYLFIPVKYALDIARTVAGHEPAVIGLAQRSLLRLLTHTGNDQP